MRSCVFDETFEIFTYISRKSGQVVLVGNSTQINH
jgi:hypothetical protein